MVIQYAQRSVTAAQLTTFPPMFVFSHIRAYRLGVIPTYRVFSQVRLRAVGGTGVPVSKTKPNQLINQPTQLRNLLWKGFGMALVPP